MDALRKAEEQKLAGQERSGQEAAPAAGLELEPVTTPGTPAPTVRPEAPPAETQTGKPARDRLPDLPTRLEELDDQFMSPAAKSSSQARTTPSPGKPAGSTREAHAELARETARQLFEAKQPSHKPSLSFAITVGLVTLVAAIAIGGYFWWQLQPKNGLVATGTAPPAPRAPIAAPSAPSSAPIAVAQPATAVPAPAVAPAPVVAAPVKPASPQEAIADAAQAQPRRPAANPVRPAPAATAQPQSPIRLSKAVQKTDPFLEQAYQAFNRGELDLAHSGWQKVLAADPRNADALHGLAAIAVQRQQPDAAAGFYLRALEVDPKDALALSGLVSLKVPADVQQTESRLKTLLAEQPDSPHLNFALGNLYARGTRWAEAQQAFFKAHVADPANPDILFNLAVSLDQLHQLRLAAQYYNQALAAAAHQPAGFDAAQVSTRLKMLQSNQQH